MKRKDDGQEEASGLAMHNHVAFRYPIEFVPVSDEEGILAVSGAQWFVSLLQRVPDLDVNEDLCQEDWGIVIFCQRAQKKFWIGLSQWDSDYMWIAHVHHDSFAWLQRLSRSGTLEFNRLISDLHKVLVNDPNISAITWYQENEIYKAQSLGSTTPHEG